MSGEQQSGAQEKSHDPTPNKLEKARQQGDVAQSKELNAAASYIGFALAIATFSATEAENLTWALLQMLERPEDFAGFAFASKSSLLIRHIAMAAGTALLAFLLLPFIATLLSLAAQRAITFSASKIRPKLSKISITENAKKKYGPSGLFEFSKSALKLLVIFAIFGVMFLRQFESLPGHSRKPAQAFTELLMNNAILFVSIICIFSICVALIDFPWTHNQHKKRLRMTYEEVKKETKETEGDPAVKQNRRSRAQSIATNKMLKDVPTASVVITNPTHFAVALKWERGSPHAPICVAKGQDEIAVRIREIAAIGGVPIRSDPPTARAIIATVEIGEEIKREHFEAVAAAINFAEIIRSKSQRV